jgi:formylglycine-generating enzyme required for sulfatase activity
VSRWGVFDMVGNLAEWVEDWQQNNAGNNEGDISTPLFGGDAIFWLDEAGPQEDRFPAALTRGGDFLFFSGSLAGVFTLTADVSPSFIQFVLGFRCAR